MVDLEPNKIFDIETNIDDTNIKSMRHNDQK